MSRRHGKTNVTINLLSDEEQDQTKVVEGKVA
jgi:hypothetical protein